MFDPVLRITAIACSLLITPQLASNASDLQSLFASNPFFTRVKSFFGFGTRPSKNSTAIADSSASSVTQPSNSPDTQISAASASPAMQPSNAPDAQLSALEDKKVNGAMGVKSPPRFQLQHANRIFLECDFLYWRAEMDNIEFAVSSTSPNDADVGEMSQMTGGKWLDIDFEWGPGFRVGIGYDTPYDCWDLFLSWTRFNHSSSGHAHQPSGGGLAATWFTFATLLGINCEKASGHWDLNYNTLDLMLSRTFFVSRALTLRPGLGIRGAWIDQDMRYHYSGVDYIFLHGFGAPLGPEKVKLSNDYHALGILAGLGLDYCFNRHWSIYGNLAGSLLYGTFEVHEHLKTKGINLYSRHVSYQFSEDRDRLKTNVEMGIGLKWETDLNHKKVHLSFFAGYEFLVWFNQNQLKNFWFSGLDNGSYDQLDGNLALQGGTFGGRIDF
ncbi:MAG: hypothetical protein JSR93_04595 [Verrucomicrobia bacterium]|nr:hypothetical protein [Verrucomicrobiota bacterium]